MTMAHHRHAHNHSPLAMPLIRPNMPAVWLITLAMLLGSPLMAQNIAPARVIEETGVAAENNDFLRPDPANDIYTFANQLYELEDFAQALQRYNEFIELHPRHPKARPAYYQTAECLRRLDRLVEAEQRYAAYADTYQTGELVDAAAFRAAALAYNRKDYQTALPYFRKTADLTEDDQLKLNAHFRIANCLQQLNRKEEAIPFFTKVAETPAPNPFLESALLALARSADDEGSKEQALEHFRSVAAKASTQNIKAEALTRAALLATDLEKPEEADSLYKEIFSLEEAEEWKPIAQFGLVRNRYTAKNYSGVVDAYNLGVFKLADDMRAQMFLMVGNAYQRLEKYPEAIRTYGILENFYEDRPEGQEAGYRKLQCFLLMEEENLPDFIDHYIRKYIDKEIDHSFLDRARLLLAEFLFSKEEFARAADAYAGIRYDKLPDSLRNPAFYKRAWAEAEAGRPLQAVEAFSSFLRLAPNDPLAPQALASRANNYHKAGNEELALADFEQVVQRYPDAPVAEFALRESASIKNSRNDTAGMISHFKTLLEKYPQSSYANEAHYSIGIGYYRQRQYKESLPYLRKSRELDPETYAEAAGRRIVLACYSLQDVPALHKEANAFIEEYGPGSIPPEVLAWLGIKLFDLADFEESSRYLEFASDANNPDLTEPVIWKFLGKAHIESGQYTKAINAIENYFNSSEHPQTQAAALLDKAHAQLMLKQFKDADETAEEGMRLVRQGPTNAWLSILRGDIAMAQNNYAEAVKHYVVPAQTIIDPEITPEALWKASEALLKEGKRQEAREFREELMNKFPDYRPPVQ